MIKNYGRPRQPQAQIFGDPLNQRIGLIGKLNFNLIPIFSQMFFKDKFRQYLLQLHVRP